MRTKRSLCLKPTKSIYTTLGRLEMKPDIGYITTTYLCSYTDHQSWVSSPLLYLHISLVRLCLLLNIDTAELWLRVGPEMAEVADRNVADTHLGTHHSHDDPPTQYRDNKE